MDPAVQEDWFPHYRRLREQAPVWQVPATGEYFLSRYEDVIYVLRHPELFPHTSTSSEFRLLQTDAANRYYEEHGWRRKQTLGIDPRSTASTACSSTRGSTAAVPPHRASPHPPHGAAPNGAPDHRTDRQVAHGRVDRRR